ncbi:RNA-directed DNA polymerase (Reverse transcriptase) domain containing protein [Elysia marginata]|uniref:RNA-directed DNA polymerase (Reverse transcriptase) domain containing protein n=1 Tax=Elysia marginata TaxID=1093978 RepID=A0AAV4IIL6_9GAST|nr:RNA-directed DNA polymerase (Reverse transcriptase) domain containing protein [Elysia marginata]
MSLARLLTTSMLLQSPTTQCHRLKSYALFPYHVAKHLTLTHQGLRQYCRLPMGLKDSASVCQRFVSQTLDGCPGTIVYIDDIFVFSSTQADHDRHLREALQRLESKDFRLQISKCEFNVSRIDFLGHIISADGITPDPKNVQPILDAPTLKTLKQIQSFLSMINYYHDFIKNLSTTAEPLRRLTRKGVKFE